MTELLLGLFGGAGATLLWEIVLRPIRERRSIAEVLSAEVSLNMQLLAAAQLHASPTKVPPDFEASMMVFDAVTARIGELPSQTVSEVIFLYRYFKQLNDIPRVYIGLVEDLRALPVDSPYRMTVEGEVQACVSVFNSYVAKAVNRCNLTQPMLVASACPRWSPRRYGRDPSKLLELDEMAERVRIAQAERAKLAHEIKRRERTSDSSDAG